MSIELSITGMSCTHCERAVQQALAGVAGVEKVQVDQPAGRATVEGNPDVDALIAAVAEEGYQAVVASPAG